MLIKEIFIFTNHFYPRWNIHSYATHMSLTLVLFQRMSLLYHGTALVLFACLWCGWCMMMHIYNEFITWMNEWMINVTVQLAQYYFLTTCFEKYGDFYTKNVIRIRRSKCLLGIYNWNYIMSSIYFNITFICLMRCLFLMLYFNSSEFRYVWRIS